MEIKPLAPMSVDEALALVIMLGGASSRLYIAFPRAPMLAKTPLQQLVASLPEHQYRVFMTTMDGAWPRDAKRDWNRAWALSLATASQCQTQIADAYYEALYGRK